MKIKNVSPLGALDVPWLDRTVQPGEIVEIPDEDAQYFLPQSEVWQQVQDTTPQSEEAKQ